MAKSTKSALLLRNRFNKKCYSIFDQAGGISALNKNICLRCPSPYSNKKKFSIANSDTLKNAQIGISIRSKYATKTFPMLDDQSLQTLVKTYEYPWIEYHDKWMFRLPDFLKILVARFSGESIWHLTFKDARQLDAWKL